MNNITDRSIPWLVGVVLALVAGPVVPAAVAGDVIVAYQRYAGKYAVMSPTGANLTMTDCGGDPTYGGSPRYFVNAAPGSNVLYVAGGYAYVNSELVASDEDCARKVALTQQGNMRFGGSRWSPDGTMIAADGEEFAGGVITRRGIYLADVVYEGSRPVGATNLRLIVPTGAARNFAWSPESRRIVYVEAGENGADLFLYYLDGGVTLNITNTPGVAEDQPAFSITERIAYTRQVSDPRGSYRYDIFSIPSTGGREVQITYKGTTGAFGNFLPGYSPDGQHIVFSSGTLQGDRALYRISAAGSGKALKLAGAKGQDWRVSFWRH